MVREFYSDIFGDNERAREQEKERKSGGYQNAYFDENESRLGQEKYDAATGKPIKNDEDYIPEGIKKIAEKELTTQDPIVEELQDDITTKWLLANGYDKFGNKIIGKDSEDKAA